MAGAAGGLAGGLWAFAGAAAAARRRAGARRWSASTRACAQAFVVVTGEGRLDEQTLDGKAVFEVATRCRQAGVPCYVVPGDDALDAFGKRLLNIEVEAAGARAGNAGRAARGGGAAARPPR